MKNILYGSIILSLFANPLYAANAEKMTKAHNIWRSKVGSSPISWSIALQKQAQAWANQLKASGCQMKHSGAGENLYWAGPHKSATSKDANGDWIWTNSQQNVSDQNVVDSWGSEVQWYDYATNKCNAPTGNACGHYTQMVSNTSTEVGCANAICDDSSQIWVCRYKPAANVISKKPY